MKPIELVLIGAGARGAHAYASFALEHPEIARFVAVAEPDPVRRRHFAAAHNLEASQCFDSWRELLDRGQLAAGAIVATQDSMHLEPATKALQTGYDVLLEKPMADSPQACMSLVRTAEETNRSLQICHVLRYTPFWRTLHQVVRSGRLGQIVTVEHRENVAWWHMAHSFVRGNWRRRGLSNPMILAKCCHDLDILVWNLNDPVVRLSSTGALTSFTDKAIGKDIPQRCTDGCPIEKECIFSAIGIYLDSRLLPTHPTLQVGETAPAVHPYITMTSDLSWSGRRQAIERGPYGRCVYRCDNDVVEQQTVLMQTASGASIALVMHGHSPEEHRSMRYDGTRATLRARFGEAGSEIEIWDHGARTAEIVPIPDTRWRSGHGGGDWATMHEFVRHLQGNAVAETDVRTSLESHLLAFAADEARRTHSVLEMDSYRTSLEKNVTAIKDLP